MANSKDPLSIALEMVNDIAEAVPQMTGSFMEAHMAIQTYTMISIAQSLNDLRHNISYFRMMGNRQ